MKKKSTHSGQPSLALALVAIVAPVLAAGIVPSFAADTGSGSIEPLTHQSGYTGHALFNIEDFLIDRRMRHAAPDTAPASSSSSVTSSAHSINPCDQQPTVSSSSSTASVHDITIFDLPQAQRDTLRQQLHNHACPQQADPAYRALCERLLKVQPVQGTHTGLTNPNQNN